MATRVQRAEALDVIIRYGPAKTRTWTMARNRKTMTVMIASQKVRLVTTRWTTAQIQTSPPALPAFKAR